MGLFTSALLGEPLRRHCEADYGRCRWKGFINACLIGTESEKGKRFREEMKQNMFCVVYIPLIRYTSFI